MPTITIRATNAEGTVDWTLDYDVIDGFIAVRAANPEGAAEWRLPYSIEGIAPPPPVAGRRISLATVDTAGGLIQNSRGIRSTINGRPIAVQGDAVVAHAPCPVVQSHCSAVTQEASRGVTINGIPIVREGDAASCGHPATAAARSTNA